VDIGQGVDAVMVGTTHFVNAVVQRRRLNKVAAIRIALPATGGLPPFHGLPLDLPKWPTAAFWQIEGGHDYDGRRFMPLDVDAARRIASEIRARGLRCAAVTAMFSPLDASTRRRSPTCCARRAPAFRVTCSHRIGGIGLLERENAAILNAALIELADETIQPSSRPWPASASRRRSSSPERRTVAEAARAAAYPIYSFASGPTNSMRGAAYLSGLKEAIVVDVGGTTSDFGHLRLGFARRPTRRARRRGAHAVPHAGPDLDRAGGGSLVDTAAIESGR